ncbi:YdeI/OmpD-associated family protein [Polaromonas sp. P1(28)-13]|nr:YdeI/OmpD-associated family protein [Polaromonas sp. P1(28)-13]
MQAAGLAEIERAKADGRWDAAYDAQSTAVIPDDLAALLAAQPKTRDFFEALDSRNRYAILFLCTNRQHAGAL